MESGPHHSLWKLLPAYGIIEPVAVLEIRSDSVIVLDAYVVGFGKQAEICMLVQPTRPSQPPPCRAQIMRRPRPHCWPCPVQLTLPVQAVSTSAMLGPGEPGAGVQHSGRHVLKSQGR